MGVPFLSSRREVAPSTLPMYTSLQDVTEKQRHSDESRYFSDDDDDSRTDISTASTSSRHSTVSSASMSLSQSAPMMRKRSPLLPTRRPAPRFMYRLPNKVIRYLCLGMITTLVIFMYSLVRASQVESRKLAEGRGRPKTTTPPEGFVWERFEFLSRYYGGVKSIKPLGQNVPQYPSVEDERPYNVAINAGEPTEASQIAASEPRSPDPKVEERRVPPSTRFVEHTGSQVPTAEDQIRECFIDAKKTVRVPSIRYLEGRPDGFPQHVIGSYEELALPEDICFDRFGRFGPYGYGYSKRTGGLGVGEHGEREGADAVWESGKVDWNGVNWADVQRRCYESNSDRFKPMQTRESPPRGWYIGGKPEKLQARDGRDEATNAEASASSSQAPKMPLTAVVVRCWDEYRWTQEAIMSMRSLITELSLASGGRYHIHLLVQVKNDARDPVWADDEIYQRVIRDRIPAEFQSLATLWTETQMLSLYQGLYDMFTRGPDLPVHGSYRGLQMAMQYFAHNHAEYDYFWQWEMDIRYIGHYYDLLTKLETWSKEQPRKGLWERNARFYFPSVHGSWEDFKQMSRVQTEIGAAVGAENRWEKNKMAGLKQEATTRKGEQTVWGPRRPVHEGDWFETDTDATPPWGYEKDKYKWGVGEEADYITLNPMYDPDGTTWGLKDDITGYNESAGVGKPPRRAHIITASRMSRKLLQTMHRETAFKKHHGFPEMWPATVALHHGYKAVYAPHPIYVDRAWPTEYMAGVFNGGRNGASGGSRASVFGDREHNLRGLTWFYDTGFASNLYRRWLGLRVNNDGGEEFELTPDPAKNGSSVSQMPGGEGRMCLPPMLLHPIKDDVQLPVEEEDVVETPVPEMDPNA